MSALSSSFAGPAHSAPGSVIESPVQLPVGIGAVRHIVIVSSGKGGVGKSTVAVNIALALWRAGHAVGLLDIDLCGPSVPRMLGTHHSQVTRCDDGWLPVYVSGQKQALVIDSNVPSNSANDGDSSNVPSNSASNEDNSNVLSNSASNEDNSNVPSNSADKLPQQSLAVMSIGFLLSRETDAVVWRGAKKTSMVESLLGQVHWGPLDWLVVDTPPGTSDEKITLATAVKTRYRDKFAGAVIVTTPQMVALGDVRKEISFYERVGLPVLGLLENMAGLACPRCCHVDRVFSMGGGAALARARSVAFLGALPLCPALARIADSAAATDFVAMSDQLAADSALHTAMTRVLEALHHHDNQHH